MAPVADDQGLALACGHPLDPEGSVSASWSIQISETADVVDLKGSCLEAAGLACLCKETLHDLAANAVVE